MSYRKSGSQQYRMFRVRYPERYTGKPAFTRPMGKGDAEQWLIQYRSTSRPQKHKVMAQVVSDVEPIQNPTPGYSKQWRVRSDSNPNKHYVVSLTPGGRWECACPHWIYRLKKQGGECKHIRKVREWVRRGGLTKPPKATSEANFFIDEHGGKQHTFLQY